MKKILVAIAIIILTTLACSSTLPTESLGIGSSRISPKDGMTLVYVPAGNFQMGSDKGKSDEIPVHTVYLSAFWIDKTDVTNDMFAVFANNQGYTTTAEKAGKSNVYIENKKSWEYMNGADWKHPRGRPAA
jgi:formylglycine-generating enzyme required for sulfatase activity